MKANLLLSIGLTVLGCSTTHLADLEQNDIQPVYLDIAAGTRLYAVPAEVEVQSTKPAEAGSFSSLAYNGNWQALELAARSTLEKQPRSAEALTYLTTALVMQRRFALAQIYLGRAQKAQPASKTNAHLLNIEAILLLNRPMADEVQRQLAISRLSECLSLKPLPVVCGLNLGNIYLSAGQGAHARKVFVSIEQGCRGCIAAREGLALAFVQLGQYPKALSLLRGMVDDDPRRVDLAVVLAGIEAGVMRRSEQARSRLEGALGALPRSDTAIRPVIEEMLRGMAPRPENIED